MDVVGHSANNILQLFVFEHADGPAFFVLRQNLRYIRCFLLVQTLENLFHYELLHVHVYLLGVGFFVLIKHVEILLLLFIVRLVSHRQIGFKLLWNVLLNVERGHLEIVSWGLRRFEGFKRFL